MRGVSVVSEEEWSCRDCHRERGLGVTRTHRLSGGGGQGLAHAEARPRSQGMETSFLPLACSCEDEDGLLGSPLLPTTGVGLQSDGHCSPGASSLGSGGGSRFLTHVCIHLGSWSSRFRSQGYTPAIKGQLLHVDATTSMQYRTLLEAEMLAVSLTFGPTGFFLRA